MKHDQQMTPLAEVATITSGKRPRRVVRVSTGNCQIPVIGGGGPSGFTDAALFDEAVLITGRVGTLGKLFVPDGPCWPSDNALVIRARDAGTDARFLRYALQHIITKLTGLNRGAANPLITQGDLGRLEIGHPCVSEQRAIAHILGTLDDKIELNRRTSETLEAMARALFKSWFVDFDPVRAKLDGRWQRGQSLRGVPAHLYDLFPDRLVDSDRGEIPKGWVLMPFGGLLEGTIGGDWGKESPKDDYDEPICIVRGTDFPGVAAGGIARVPTRYTTKKKLQSRLLRNGDIVVEVSGGSPTQPTGRSICITQSILDRFPHPVVCASFCRRFRPENAVLGAIAIAHLKYLYDAGGTWEYQNQSTGIANFQTSHFLRVEIVVMPPAPVAAAFAHHCWPLIERASSNASLSLIYLRDALLPKLISGELRAEDAERFVEAAV